MVESKTFSKYFFSLFFFFWKIMCIIENFEIPTIFSKTNWNVIFYNLTPPPSKKKKIRVICHNLLVINIWGVWLTKWS